jgi:hypothetical protein
MVIGAVSVTYLRSVFGSDGAVVTPVGSDTARSTCDDHGRNGVSP